MTGNKDSKNAFTIAVAHSADDSEAQHIASALADEIAAKFGPPDSAAISLRAHEGGALVGGLNGHVHWRWFYIRHLWVAEAHRRAGVGRRLIDAAETEARQRNCVGIYIDTFEQKVAQFYERAGFTRCGAIPEFPPGHARIFLKKSLSA